MAAVFDLAEVMNAMSGATEGLERSMARDANREAIEQSTARAKLEMVERENEILRENTKRENLGKRAAWMQKWMGREDRDDMPHGLGAEALERIAGVARRGPLAFGAAYGQEWARELHKVQTQKRREAEELAAQMDPESAMAYLDDQEAERREEIELGARGALRNGLAKLVSNASAIGMDEGILDVAETMADLVDKGAIPLAEAEDFMFQTMDRIAVERKNLRARERTISRLDQMAAESEDPGPFEDLAADVEAGLIEADEAYALAKQIKSGLQAPLRITLPGIKEPIESRTELFKGNGRSSRTLPKSARAEAYAMAEQLCWEEPGWEDLSPEEQEKRIAKKTLNLIAWGGWEIDPEDRDLLEGSGESGSGETWTGLTPARQDFARKALLEAAKAGATTEQLHEVADGLGVMAEDLPPDLLDELAEAYAAQQKGGGAPRGNEQPSIGATRARDMMPPTDGRQERAPRSFFDQAGIQNPPSTQVRPDGAAQPAFPPKRGSARPGTALSPQKVQELLEALKGGGK